MGVVKTLMPFAGKERKETGNFIGAEGVRKVLKEGPTRRRVGLVVEGAPARRAFPCATPGCQNTETLPFTEGAKIFSPSGKEHLGLLE